MCTHCWQPTLFKGCRSEILELFKRVVVEILSLKRVIYKMGGDKIIINKKVEVLLRRGDCLTSYESGRGEM